MSLRTPASGAFSVLQIAFAFGLALSPICVSAQQQGIFSRFAGDWSGEGTVKTAEGGHERIRCKAHYNVAPDGASLEQNLRCASDSYKLEIRSKVVSNGNTFTGKWTEITRDTIGNVSGTITGSGIRGKIDGIGFTAELAISTQANRQSVTIDPTGASDISHVSITMTKI
jgi:hypothetical protein